MSFNDGNPCDSNDALPLLLDASDQMEIIPCIQITHPTLTISSQSSTTTAAPLPSSTTSTVNINGGEFNNTSDLSMSPLTSAATTAATTTAAATTTTAAVVDADATSTVDGSSTSDSSTPVNAPSTAGATSSTAATPSSPTPQSESGVDAAELPTNVSGRSDTDPENDVNTTSSEVTSTAMKSFYSCYPDASVRQPPPGSFQLDLVYDYELHWTASAEAAANMLSALENRILMDLVEQYGLLSCDIRKAIRRRHLRSTERLMSDNNVAALGSDPKDQSVDNIYDCEVEVDLDTPATCTPIRGYMTAWLKSNTNMAADEEEILAFIQAGMENDKYLDNEVRKLSYIGTRDAKDTSVSSNVAADPKETTQLTSSGPPILAIGLAVFFIAFALIALFVVVAKRRKQADEEEEESPPPQVVPRPEPDDITLLPVHDTKLDMRSVHSGESSDSTATETHAIDGRGEYTYGPLDDSVSVGRIDAQSVYSNSSVDTENEVATVNYP